MDENVELRSILNEAAQELANREKDPSVWVEWVAYLLETLELHAMANDPDYPQGFNDMLQSLRDRINDRLKEVR